MANADTQSVEDFRKALQDEYGTFVAIEAIDHDGARAYNPGDPVPVSNVQLHKYDDQGLVARRTTKAAKQATSTDA
jgi:hypothetical protein